MLRLDCCVVALFDRFNKTGGKAADSKSAAPRERVTPWQYLREVRDELVKVSWPKRQEVVQGTIRVIIVSLFFAALLGAVDFGAQRGLDKLLSRLPEAQTVPATAPQSLPGELPTGLPEGIPSPIVP